MKDEDKTKKQLIDEFLQIRKRIADLEGRKSSEIKLKENIVP